MQISIFSTISIAIRIQIKYNVSSEGTAERKGLNFRQAWPFSRAKIIDSQQPIGRGIGTLQGSTRHFVVDVVVVALPRVQRKQSFFSSWYQGRVASIRSPRTRLFIQALRFSLPPVSSSFPSFPEGFLQNSASDLYLLRRLSFELSRVLSREKEIFCERCDISIFFFFSFSLGENNFENTQKINKYVEICFYRYISSL